MTRIIDALSDLHDRYDAVLCDVWGVIHDGREAFGPAVDALAAFRATGRPVVLISNAPRPSHIIPGQLARLRVRDDAWDAIVTSGDATIAEIRKRGPRAYKIGPSKDEGLYDGLPVDFQGADTADYVICTGLRDELEEPPESYAPELERLAARRLPFVCANPDRVVQFGGRLIPCAGAIADVYAAMGGEVVMAGKPYAPIYDLAYAALDKTAGRAIDRSRILAIGDGIPTDVLGAQNQGLDCLFVAGGIHAADLSGPHGLDPDKVAGFLSGRGASAAWGMTELA